MKFLPTLLLLLIGSLGLAQEDERFAIEYSIDSEAFKTERKITVYLPPTFYRYPDDAYTVTYVLDGQYAPFIDLAVNVIEYNVNASKFIPTIVVGIHSENRGAEFSMPKPEDEYQNGRAPALQRHLREEVMPLVASLYPGTDRFKTLVGHSSGAAFALLTLLGEQHDLFDAYIGISPALRPGQNTILEDAERFLKENKNLGKFLYCSAGTIGEREELFGGAIDRLDSLLEVYPDHGIDWRQQRFEGLDHWSVVAPSLLYGELHLTRTFRADLKNIVDLAGNGSLPLKDQLDDFYRRLDDVYDYAHLPTAGYLHRAARELTRLDMPDRAIELYDWSLEAYPDHFQLTKFRSLALAELGLKREAAAGFRTARSILNNERNEFSEQEFSAQLDDLEARIKKLEAD